MSTGSNGDRVPAGERQRRQRLDIEASAVAVQILHDLSGGQYLARASQRLKPARQRDRITDRSIARVAAGVDPAYHTTPAKTDRDADIDA